MSLKAKILLVFCLLMVYKADSDMELPTMDSSLNEEKSLSRIALRYMPNGKYVSSKTGPYGVPILTAGSDVITYSETFIVHVVENEILKLAFEVLSNRKYISCANNGRLGAYTSEVNLTETFYTNVKAVDNKYKMSLKCMGNQKYVDLNERNELVAFVDTFDVTENFEVVHLDTKDPSTSE